MGIAPLSISRFTLLAATQYRRLHSPPTDLHSLLQRCCTIDQLKQIHTQSLHLTRTHIPFFTNLIRLYAKWGNFNDALHLFHQIPIKDVFVWNVIIAQLTENGFYGESFDYFNQMRGNGSKPNSYTFSPLLNCCLHVYESQGIVHCMIVKSGFDLDPSVSTALVNLYGKLGFLVEARTAFDHITYKDGTAFTVMMGAFTDNDAPGEAIALFQEMREQNREVGSATFVLVLKACQALLDARFGKLVHCLSIKAGFGSDCFVCSSLISLYARNWGDLLDARKVFDFIPERDVALWNSMIFGYAHSGLEFEAFDLYKQMIVEDVRGNKSTMIGLLKACTASGFVNKGELVHCHCIKTAFESDLSLATSLLEFYSKSARMASARKLFDEMPQRNVVSWHVLLIGLVQNGHACEALDLFQCMQGEIAKLDRRAVACALVACTRAGRLTLGKCIHAYITRRFDGFGIVTSTALVDMYAKCGCLVYARTCFDKAAMEKNLFGWSSMIDACGKHGSAAEALRLFDEMVERGVEPDEVTFLSVLSACSHAGLVDQGKRVFARMSDDFAMEADARHYACMVDLLGRAGRLDEAWEFMGQMPVEVGASGIGALLGACRTHGAIDLAESVAEMLGSSGVEDDGIYTLFSNLYGSAARWDEAAKVRLQMDQRGLRKTPGCSSIER